MSVVSKLENGNKFSPFRLPFLSIQQVLKFMSPFELINISKTSSKIKQIIKSFTKAKCKDCYEIKVTIVYKPMISIIEYGKEFRTVSKLDIVPNNNLINAQQSYDPSEIEFMEIYSDDVLSEMKKSTEYIAEILNSPIYEVFICMDTFPGQNKSIIDWLKSQTQAINIFSATGITVPDEEFSYLLNNLTVTKHLALAVKPSDRFRNEMPSNLYSLEVVHAKWITLNQLLKLNCTEISLFHSNLTNTQLNAFISSWMLSECLKNLQYFQVILPHINTILSILEIPYEPVDFNLEREFKRGSKRIKLRGGVDIKRNDGKKATLFFSTSHDNIILSMLVHS